MKYEENRSQVWFKVLSREGISIDQETTIWDLPKGIQKGKWLQSESPIGTMLVSNPTDFAQKSNRLFVVEYTGNPLVEVPGIMWVKSIRLVREATSLDLKRFGIFRAIKQIF